MGRFEIQCLMIVITMAFQWASYSSVIINVTETMGDVVFDVSGSLDLTDAVEAPDTCCDEYGLGMIGAGDAWYLASGPGIGAYQQYYLTSWAGPFGSSTEYFYNPSTSYGDIFFIFGYGAGNPQVAVTDDYESGDMISSGMSFAGSSFSDLGLIVGSYLYEIPNSTITLNIGYSVAVPEPGIFVLLLIGLTVLGAIGFYSTNINKISNQ